MSETLTITLDGKVTLDDLATAVNEFRNLVLALTEETAAGEQIEWVITDLEAGSASATAQGYGRTEAVETVVRAYDVLGERLERSERIPYSQRVQVSARRLISLVDGRIQEIRLETDRQVATIRKPQAEAIVLPLRARGKPVGAYGAVEGMIQTLSNRGRLRFTLFDLLNDRAVSCYIAAGREEIMRDAWGRRAIVYGLIQRDELTGRAISVREVTSVQIVVAYAPDEWRKARGAAPAMTDVPPEDSVRAVRDA